MFSSQNVTGLVANGVNVVVNSTQALNLPQLATQCGAAVETFVVNNSTQFKTLCSSSTGMVQQVLNSAPNLVGKLAEGGEVASSPLTCVMESVCGVSSYAVLAAVGLTVFGAAAVGGVALYMGCKKSKEVEMQTLKSDATVSSYGATV